MTVAREAQRNIKDKNIETLETLYIIFCLFSNIHISIYKKETKAYRLGYQFDCISQFNGMNHSLFYCNGNIFISFYTFLHFIVF